MTEKPVLFVTCTQRTEKEFELHSETYQFFRDNKLEEGKDYFVFFENKIGLSNRYNQFLKQEFADKIVVFVHDDVRIGYHLTTLRRELNKAHEHFDIVGLAGATKLNLTFPTLWHLMQTGMSGSVGHGNGHHSQMSNYGPSPARCMVVDGLFMSVNVDRVIKAHHKFDEGFTFHHYDLDFCIQAETVKRLLVGTWPIWVTHMSPGLRSLEDETWKKSNKTFCLKYNIV